MTRTRRALAYAGLTGAGALLAFALGVAAPFDPGDEPWFLQVAHRVAAGETLYRDVAFGVTPLSVQGTAACVRLFGTEVVVLRALLALSAALAALLAALVVRRATGGRGGAVAGLAALAVGAAGACPLYSPLATLLLLAAFLAALSDEERAASLLAGALAGLCFAAKQNVGLLALAALLAAAVTRRGRRPLARRLALALAGFAAAAILPLVPVALSGGFPALLDLGFLGKGSYVALGRVSYTASFTSLLALAPREGPEPLLLATLFLVGPFALAGLAAAWRSAPAARRPALLRVMAFTAAGLLAVYPRADVIHLCYPAPVLLAGLAVAWHELSPRFAPALRRGVPALAAAWAVLWLGMRGVPPALAYRAGRLQASTLPHFRGVLIAPAVEASVHEDAARFAAAARGGLPLVLLSHRAGLFYLVSGVPNPTRFDYPWVTTFGRSGEAELQGTIASGRAAVFVDRERRTDMNPVALEQLAAERLTLRAAWRSGLLYAP